MFRSGFARCPLDGTPLQQLVDDPLTGSMFADRYVIERCIGEGAMGRVYRARHQRVSRKFAIKVLYGDHATDPKMRERFALEAEAASRLDHRNVISVVDFGETDEGLLYLVMDFVEGRELAEVIHDAGPLEPERIERILRDLCSGLVHAHEKGLVHRDFKGENVLLTGAGDDEVARIVDFGIAFMLEVADVQRLTTEGIVLGTPAYMSPEQASGAELDHRTDLYSLGVLLYEMIAGVLPFEGPPMAVARMNLAVEPPPIGERVPGLRAAPRLEAIAMRLLQKRPEDRHQSARDVLDALDAAQSLGQAETARATAAEPGDAEEMRARPRGGRARWVVPAVAAVAAVAAILLFALGRGDERSTAAAPPIDAAPVAALAPPADAAAAATTRTPEPKPKADEPEPRTDEPKPKPDEPKPKPDELEPKADELEPKADEPEPKANKPEPKPEPKPKPITTRDLTARYKATGEAIERLAERRGDDAAAQFRARYSRIPFSDALRTPSLRREVDGDLRELEAQVKRALRKR